MQHIRSHRNLNCSKPTRHCMYGNDADLIMLALATHEPYFTLLREVIDFGASRRVTVAAANVRSTVLRQSRSSDFQLLHLSLLREYVQLEFCCLPPASYSSCLEQKDSVKTLACYGHASVDDISARLCLRGVAGRAYDLERLIDDFVFMTFFVGNDFLPHSPSLDIGEHAFTRIFAAYKRHLATWPPGNYLTNVGKIADAARLQSFVADLGSMEPAILLDRRREARRDRRTAANGRSGEQKAFPGDDPGDDSVSYVAFPPGAANSEHEKYYLRTLGISALLNNPVAASGMRGIAQTPPAAKMTARGIEWEAPTRDSRLVIARLSAAFVEGLAWCLAYYVIGCVDWRWFFPCHYCPMLADVEDITGALADAQFEVGAPLRPLEQLMSCLPPASAGLLPQPHRSLMLEVSSPLAEFYPDDFMVDMDGKRNPWEGVNLLPFIEVDRLIDAVTATCENVALAANERIRAQFGRSVVFASNPVAGSTAAAPSNADAVNVDGDGIDLALVAERDEHLGVAESWLAYGPPFRAVIRDCCAAPIPGFPSLHALPIIGAELKALKLDCFGSPSRYETVCLKLPLPTRTPTARPGVIAASVAAALLGKSIFVNWPMTHEARLVAVTGGERHYTRDGSCGAIAVSDLDAKAASSFDIVCVAAASRALIGQGNPGDGGTDIGPIDVILTVNLLQGLERNPATGALVKVYGRENAEVPLQLTLSAPPHTHVNDPRFQERGPLMVSSRFAPGCRVIFVSGSRLGQIGIVRQCDNLRNAVMVDTLVEDVEPQFGLGIAAALTDKFASAALAAAELGLREKVLTACCGSVLVRDDARGTLYDLGLRLFVDGGAFLTLGYCRAAYAAGNTPRVDRAIDGRINISVPCTNAPSVAFEYSAKAIRLVTTYRRRFPEVFDALTEATSAPTDIKNGNNADRAVITFAGASCIFGHDEPEVRLLEACRWLANLPTATTTRAPVSTMAMSPEAVAAVQRAATKRVAIRAHATIVRDTVSAPAATIQAEQESGDTALSARILNSNVRDAPPRLGERVVAFNTDQIGAPFGHRGTVIAIHARSAAVDVVFDEPFVGGTSLQGACDNFRGLLCPWSALLPLRDSAPDVTVTLTTQVVSGSIPLESSFFIPPPSRLKDHRLAKGPEKKSGFSLARSVSRRSTQISNPLSSRQLRHELGLSSVGTPVSPSEINSVKHPPAVSRGALGARPTHDKLPESYEYEAGMMCPFPILDCLPSAPATTTPFEARSIAPGLLSLASPPPTCTESQPVLPHKSRQSGFVELASGCNVHTQKSLVGLSYGYQPATNPFITAATHPVEPFTYIPVSTSSTTRVPRTSRAAGSRALQVSKSLERKEGDAHVADA
mmetsp:Transcript_1533/g.4612  ORF Transcript_1533/g.4612 Transcript_1533/m.4612 type:complete len:1355 (-) Transcript_1533:80-4144(-)